MIFNQQALLLHGTENREQRTMILIQGKSDIYFKYFCRMTEVIYSVIIRHIVKWTIVETVIPAGSGESPCTLCSASCQGLSVSQGRVRGNVHIPTWILQVDSPFCLHKKLLMQVLTLEVAWV